MRFFLPAMLLLLSLVLIAAEPASQPAATSQPASQPAIIRLPLGEKRQFDYTPPPGWDGPMPTEPSEQITFNSTELRGTILLELAPTKMETVNKKVADAIVDMLKKNGNANGARIVHGPTIEKDPRFQLRITETKMLANGNLVDQLHLYRTKDFRVVMLTAVAYTDAPETPAVIEAAENLMISVTSSGGKPPKVTPKKSPAKATSKPVTRPSVKATTRPIERAK